MRSLLALGLTGLLLAGCSASNGPGDDQDHVPVCQEQSDMAQLGKVTGGEISISCPDHGIGPYAP